MNSSAKITRLTKGSSKLQTRGPSQPPGRLSWIAPAAVMLVGLAGYFNSLDAPFIFDDQPAIKNNPTIRRLWPIPIRPPQNTTVEGRPVGNITLAVNYALDGLNVWGYHAFNVGVHLLAALLLLGIFRRTLELPCMNGRFAGKSGFLALAVAALWAVHPLCTESVTYVVQRVESLSGMFYLLTLYCVIRMACAKRGRWWLAAGLATCALGMGTKEVMVTAPVVILLYDRIFLSGSFKETFRRRWALYVGLAATWAVLAALMLSSGSRSGTAGFAGKVSPWAYLSLQVIAAVHYLQLSLWPGRLCFDYGPFSAPSPGEVLPCAIAVATMIAITIVGLRKRPKPAFLGAAFFIILSPSSSVVPVQTEGMAEHRMYLALSAVIGLVVIIAHEAWQRLATRLPQRWAPIRMVVPAAFLTMTVAILAWRTSMRNDTYRSELSIWQDTVDNASFNPRAHATLGDALDAAGRKPDAIEQYREAIKVGPDYLPAYVSLADSLASAGQTVEAIDLLRDALRINPDYPVAHNNLGTVLWNTGQRSEAIDEYSHALWLADNFPEAHYNLGNALFNVGRPADAIEHYQKALKIWPRFADAHNNLGLAFFNVGRTSEAVEQYRESLRLRPDFPIARENLRAAMEALQQNPATTGSAKQ